jgi:membrane associated rhomboid family serine protease
MSFNHNYNRGMQITPVVRDLLIINILFFVATQFSSQLNELLALYYPSSSRFKGFQVVTHFFMHANPMHLFFNMLGLYSLGVMLEMVWGGKRFLTFYFICAFGAAAVHLGVAYWQFAQMESLMLNFTSTQDISTALQFYAKAGYELNTENPLFIQNQMEEILLMQKNIPMVGASGAIYGLMAAIWYLFPETAFYMYFIPVPIKARYLVPVIIASDFYFGFSNFGGDNVAHFAHIGGAFVGLATLFFWYKNTITK